MTTVNNNNVGSVTAVATGGICWWRRHRQWRLSFDSRFRTDPPSFLLLLFSLSLTILLRPIHEKNGITLHVYWPNRSRGKKIRLRMTAYARYFTLVRSPWNCLPACHRGSQSLFFSFRIIRYFRLRVLLPLENSPFVLVMDTHLITFLSLSSSCWTLHDSCSTSTDLIHATDPYVAIVAGISRENKQNGGEPVQYANTDFKYDPPHESRIN